MSARRATPEARCVWLTREQIVGHDAIIIPPLHESMPWNVGCQCGWEDTADSAAASYARFAWHLSMILHALHIAWDAAPADPKLCAVKAARAYFQSMWFKPGIDASDTAAAVLVALGFPDGSPRQENPTP